MTWFDLDLTNPSFSSATRELYPHLSPRHVRNPDHAARHDQPEDGLLQNRQLGPNRVGRAVHAVFGRGDVADHGRAVVQHIGGYHRVGDQRSSRVFQFIESDQQDPMTAAVVTPISEKKKSGLCPKKWGFFAGFFSPNLSNPPLVVG